MSLSRDSGVLLAASSLPRPTVARHRPRRCVFVLVRPVLQLESRRTSHLLSDVCCVVSCTVKALLFLRTSLRSYSRQDELTDEIRKVARTCAEMRHTANELLALEEWLQAQSILETLLTVEDEGSDGYRRVLRCDDVDVGGCCM